MLRSDLQNLRRCVSDLDDTIRVARHDVGKSHTQLEAKIVPSKSALKTSRPSIFHGKLSDRYFQGRSILIPRRKVEIKMTNNHTRCRYNKGIFLSMNQSI